MKELEEENSRLKRIVANPFSGGGTSPKGDAIVAFVELAGAALKFYDGRKVGEDFEIGISQIPSAQNALNDLQFALNSNLVPSKNLGQMSLLVNYLLDGEEPKFSYIIKNKDGATQTVQAIDYKTLGDFQKIKTDITKERKRLSQENLCVPCIK